MSSADASLRGTTGVSFAASLEFKDIDVRLGGRSVLDRFSLSLRPGEIVCLLGESGSGKSTALRAAAGIQPVHGGVILIDDVVMSSTMRTVPVNRRGVGMMFQDLALFPHLTVLQNTMFGLRRLDRAAAVAQARAALLRVGLSDRENDYPHMLSGGQQQRLALARSVAPRPSVLLLDEPFSSLDARLRETVREETRAVLRETNVTSIIVTHDPEEAMLLGDRVALLRQGRIAQIGTAAEIYRQPVDLDAARFLSTLSEIGSVVSDGRADTPLGSVATPGIANGRNVTIALRATGGIRLSLDSGGTPGRIIGKRDAIGIDICEVLVHGLSAPLGVRQPSNPDFVVGRDVFVSLEREHVLVFARD